MPGKQPRLARLGSRIGNGEAETGGPSSGTTPLCYSSLDPLPRPRVEAVAPKLNKLSSKSNQYPAAQPPTSHPFLPGYPTPAPQGQAEALEREIAVSLNKTLCMQSGWRLIFASSSKAWQGACGWQCTSHLGETVREMIYYHGEPWPSHGTWALSCLPEASLPQHLLVLPSTST